MALPVTEDRLGQVTLLASHRSFEVLSKNSRRHKLMMQAKAKALRSTASLARFDARLSQLSPKSIRISIRKSPLMKEGGFQVFEGVIDARIRKDMLAEALALLPSANACEVSAADFEEVRGGKPRRSFINGRGGSLQEAFYSAPWLLDFLRSLTHSVVTPTGALGTYSYYIRPGDFLDIHRDIVECDVAVISCVSEGPMDDGDGGRLCLYPERLFEPLSSIRATPQKGAVKVRLDPGQTIVLYGGIVPHALLKVAQGQARIVSVLCYRAT